MFSALSLLFASLSSIDFLFIFAFISACYFIFLPIDIQVRFCDSLYLFTFLVLSWSQEIFHFFLFSFIELSFVSFYFSCIAHNLVRIR